MSERVKWGALSARERDALVAERVMGWPVIGDDEPYRHHVHKGGVVTARGPQAFRGRAIPDRWFPSTDIAAAWDVVDKLLETGRWATIEVERLGTSVYLSGNKAADDVEAVRLPAPEAICIAALRSVGVDVEDE